MSEKREKRHCRDGKNSKRAGKDRPAGVPDREEQYRYSESSRGYG